LLQLIAEGKTQAEAGKLVGYTAKSAGDQVSRMLSNPQTQREFQKILEKIYPDDRLADKLIEITEAQKVISATIINKSGDLAAADSMTKDFIEVADYPTQLKAAELIAKLKGHLSDKVLDVNFNFSALSDEQLAEIIAGRIPKDL
jgi:phage terminase small subunit